MYKPYLKPDMESCAFPPEHQLCATSDRDGTLSDYEQDNEFNFFSGL